MRAPCPARIHTYSVTHFHTTDTQPMPPVHPGACAHITCARTLWLCKSALTCSMPRSSAAASALQRLSRVPTDMPLRAPPCMLSSARALRTCRNPCARTHIVSCSGSPCLQSPCLLPAECVCAWRGVCVVCLRVCEYVCACAYVRLCAYAALHGSRPLTRVHPLIPYDQTPRCGVRPA